MLKMADNLLQISPHHCGIVYMKSKTFLSLTIVMTSIIGKAKAQIDPLPIPYRPYQLPTAPW